MSDYLYDKDQRPDPEVADLERVLGALEHREPLRTPLPSQRPSSPRSGAAIAIAVVTFAAAAAIALAVWPRDDALPGDDPAVAELTPPPVPGDDPPLEPAAPSCKTGEAGFAFATKGGAASCNGGEWNSGVLPIGVWLETTSDVSAEVAVADIGELTVHGDSRLRLVETGPSQHRLELARGRIEALVTAPPRLFVVDTPAATAVDLGCEYELSVDEGDRTHLRVTLGAVSLERKERVAWVPMGNEVAAEPGHGPGIPVRIDADPGWRASIAALDSGDQSTLAAVVASAGEDDVGTLWNLLARADAEHRPVVFARLSALRPLPKTLDKKAVLDGDPEALEQWRAELEAELFE